MISLKIIVSLTLLSLAQVALGLGGCNTSSCRFDSHKARECCYSGRNNRCCFYTGGEGGDGWNHGGSHSNNKPGSCPAYNGRRRRSPEPRWNTGGSGYNPGHSQGQGGERCIRDSECPGAMKCCYRYSGYQCTRPLYYG